MSVPDDIRFDGYDLSDLLLHDGTRASNMYAYFLDNKTATGLRIGNWKISLPQEAIKGNFWRASTAAHDTLLFNLKDDPSETTNLFHKYPEKAKEMTIALDAYKTEFGYIPPALVMTGNHQGDYLRKQRRDAIENALRCGIQGKENLIDGFIEAK